MAIKNKLTVTRGEGGRGWGAKKRKGREGTCLKDPQTKTTGEGRIECGRWGWVGDRGE